MEEGKNVSQTGCAAISINNTDTLEDLIKEEKVDEIPGSDDTKCDICTPADVDNITNSLAEKVNIKSSEPSGSLEDNKAECDNKVEQKDVAEVIVPGTLIHQVKKLGISEHSKESVVIVKHQTDSLKNLLAYDSSSSEEEVIETNWPFDHNDKSSSDSDDSDSSSVSSDSEEDGACAVIKKPKASGQQNADPAFADDCILKLFGETDVKGLPPVRDVSKLNIDYEKEEFLHMGNIDSIIETLITVQALPGIPTYDLDTCLFIEDQTSKKPMGAIYDAIGPVESPLYCIRTNYNEVTQLKLKNGMKVFCAPKSEFTKYVYLPGLMKHKGSDASWVNDIELPPEFAALLSDDECDMPELETARQPQKRKHGSQERHKRFEEDMNRCNALHTHAARLVDAHRPRMSRYNDHAQRVLLNNVVARASSNTAPAFDPTVPPPGFPRAQLVQQPIMWDREQRMPVMRPPRCHPPYWHSQGHYSNYPSSYRNNDANQAPGSSHHSY